MHGEVVYEAMVAGVYLKGYQYISGRYAVVGEAEGPDGERVVVRERGRDLHQLAMDVRQAVADRVRIRGGSVMKGGM